MAPCLSSTESLRIGGTSRERSAYIRYIRLVSRELTSVCLKPIEDVCIHLEVALGSSGEDSCEKVV